MKVLAQKDINIMFLVVLATSLFVLMIDLVNQLLLTEVKNPAYKFIEAIPEE